MLKKLHAKIGEPLVEGDFLRDASIRLSANLHAAVQPVGLLLSAYTTERCQSGANATDQHPSY